MFSPVELERQTKAPPKGARKTRGYSARKFRLRFNNDKIAIIRLVQPLVVFADFDGFG
jgi:hypothetical protein